MGGSRFIIPDRIVCLSLESRPDRWKAFTESFYENSKLPCHVPIERYRARLPHEMIIPDWWVAHDGNPSHYATRADHLAIIEQSYVLGHRSLLIFEDDGIVQPCFDEAYEAACATLPDRWMGLWLTSDGHQKDPILVNQSLYRSTSQIFLHAYLLSRKGMRRVWSHVTYNNSQGIDHAIADLMGIEPHFYSTTRNAVIQIGDRRNGVSPRMEYLMRKERVIDHERERF